MKWPSVGERSYPGYARLIFADREVEGLRVRFLGCRARDTMPGDLGFEMDDLQAKTQPEHNRNCLHMG